MSSDLSKLNKEIDNVVKEIMLAIKAKDTKHEYPTRYIEEALAGFAKEIIRQSTTNSDNG